MLEDAGNFYLGTGFVNRLYLGDTLIWPKTSSDDFWQFTENPCEKTLSNFRVVFSNGNITADWGDNNVSGIYSNINYSHTFCQNPEVLSICVRTGTEGSPTPETYRALFGWDVGLGRVASFSNIMGVNDLANSNYRKLVQNTVQWLTKSIPAPRILILNDSRNTNWPSNISNILQAIGGITTISTKEWYNYDGVDLSTSNYDLIIPGGNYNWPLDDDMPSAGQNAIVNFVNAGGAMLTCEWIYWRIGVSNTMSTLETILPGVGVNGQYSSPTSAVTFSVVSPNTIINTGVPNPFSMFLENIAGVHSDIINVKQGATIFYNLSYSTTTTSYSSPFCINYKNYLQNPSPYIVVNGPYPSGECSTRCI
jgi:hypothetical protein